MREGWDPDKLLHEALEGHAIAVTFAEAHLLDWVLTAHQWDQDLVGRLDADDVWAVREQVGRVLTKQADTVRLDDDAVRLLLIVVPVLFAVGTEEVGSSLKIKLYQCLVGKPPEPEAPPTTGSSNTSTTDLNLGG